MKKLISVLNTLFIAMSVSVLFAGCVIINIGNDSPGRDSIQARGDRVNYEIRTGAFNRIKAEGSCEIQYYS